MPGDVPITNPANDGECAICRYSAGGILDVVEQSCDIAASDRFKIATAPCGQNLLIEIGSEGFSGTQALGLYMALEPLLGDGSKALRPRSITADPDCLNSFARQFSGLVKLE